MPGTPRTVLRYGTADPTEAGGSNSTRSPGFGSSPKSGKAA